MVNQRRILPLSTAGLWNQLPSQSCKLHSNPKEIKTDNNETTKEGKKTRLSEMAMQINDHLP
jgi:hypothetical protein